MPKYLGPADVFLVGGKAYHQGDNVPLSKELMAHHGQQRNGGHRFEGVEVEIEPAPVVAGLPPGESGERK